MIVLWCMMDSKRRSKDTMNKNVQTIRKQADTSLTDIAVIRFKPGGPLDMQMNMISIEALDMKKDTTGPMGGTPATNSTMDMSLTNGK